MRFMTLISVLSVVWPLAAAQLESGGAVWRIDDRNGALASVKAVSGETVLTRVENRYCVMSASGDRTLSEARDRVVNDRSANGRIILDCRNGDMPGLGIVKEYWIENNGLRRKLTFTGGAGAGKQYLTPVTELFFAPEFRRGSYILGSGYIGPLIPFPQVTEPTPVVQYYQTTKGMVLSNPPGRKSFAHYRLQLNDKTVFPWWQSTINSYREKPNILYYTPDGWSMALGTIDLEPGKRFSVTDTMNLFGGTWFEFFDDVYGADPVVRGELDAIRPTPEWLKDVRLVTFDKSELGLRRLAEATGDGYIMVLLMRLTGDWGDYRFDKDGANGFFGGHISGPELRDYIKSLKAISPRIKVGLYNWITSADVAAPVYKEHPEWFKSLDRDGNESHLFPGSAPNFGTMVNRPDCAEFMWKQLLESSDYLGTDYIYLDETKTTNFINWQTGELVRDDHWYDLWRNLKAHSAKPLFFNGRGNPYGDINFIEAYHQLEPGMWREFAGMGLGVEAFLKLRPDARISPLYWNSKVDYATRLLALGWIPTLADSTDNLLNHLDFVRAAYETGNADPLNAVYTPDWKKDPGTKIESYAVRRRDSSDVLMSFINRTGKTGDVPVSVDLASLGFKPAERINIWGMKVDKDTEPRYTASDAEWKAARDKQHWLGGLVTAPELLYSGPAAGTWRETVKSLADNQLYQLLITPSPLAVYALDGLGANYFYTARKGLRINGMKIAGELDNIEIILADREHTFTDIRVNGNAVPVESVDVGGMLFPVIRLGKGSFAVTAKPEKRPVIAPAEVEATLTAGRIDSSAGVPLALEFKGRTLFTGPAPILLPEHRAGGRYLLRQAGRKEGGIELDIPAGEKCSLLKLDYIARHPQQRFIGKVEGHPFIRERATWLGPWTETMRLYRNQSPRVAAANPERQVLQTGQTRRIENYLGGAFAGFELDGVRKLELQLDNSFYNAATIEQLRHVEKYRRSPREFAGFVVDYRVNGKYMKRVAFSVGVLSPKAANPMPDWGKNSVPDQYVDLGNLIDGGPRKVFTLDLSKWAPKDWDGTAYFSLGTDYIKPDRRLSATILAVNDQAKAPALNGSDADTIRREFNRPKTLDVPLARHAPRSMKELYPSEWRQWAEINRFFLIGGAEYPKMPTEAWFIHDANYLYIGIKCTETRRRPVTGNPAIWNDDEVELWFKGTNLIQILVNAAGQSMILKDGAPDRDSGVVIRSEIREKSCYYIFVAVPFKLLGGKPESIPFNICRSRLPGNGLAHEYSTWGRIMSSFKEVENFGTLRFEKSPEDSPVANLGIPGQTAGQMAASQLKKAVELKPDLTIILAGTNDMVNSGKLSTPGKYEKDLRRLVDGVLAGGSKAMLVTLPPCSEKLLLKRHRREAFKGVAPNDRIREANQIIARVAAEKQIPLVDFHREFAMDALDEASSLLRNPANSKAEDGVHPTAAGYAVLAKLIADRIEADKLPHSKIVCIGDSITFGSGVKREECYPARLNKLLDDKERPQKR